MEIIMFSQCCSNADIASTYWICKLFILKSTYYMYSIWIIETQLLSCPPLTHPQGLDGLKSMCRVKHDSHQFHSGGNRPCGPVIGEERVHGKTAAEIHLVCWSRAGLEQEVHISNIMKNRSNVSAISISHSSPLLIQLITLLNSILLLLYITVCRIAFIVYRLKHFHLQLPLQILIF